MKKRLLIMLRQLPIWLLFMLPFAAFSQDKVVTGKVTDSKDGSPIAGISVTVSGTKRGTVTAADGTFKIGLAPGSTKIIVSGSGYEKQEINVVGKTDIAVSLLASAASSLNDVVVIGYGSVRKKDLTGAAVSVGAKDFNKGAITSPDQLLQGKVPGLEITANSGQPGAATTIKIRGNNSIRTANNPLYVIDGVALDGRTAKPSLNLGGTLDFGTTPESNPLLYINPNDIAQIDVLKDASSTAIYGSRGANGIIVITTKKSTANNGTKLEFASNFGFNAGFMKKYDVMTADEFRAQSLKNTLVQDSGASVNALKAITQNAFSQNYSLSLSGGSDNGKYRASFLGSSTQGFVKNSSLDKYIGTFGGQYKFLDKRLSIDFNLIAGHTTENMALVSNTAGAGGNLISWALNWNPTRSFYASDGSYNNISKNNFNVPNPLAILAAYHDVANVNTFLGNISAGLKLTNDLEYKFLFAVNHGTGTRNTNIDGWVDGVKGISNSGFGAISYATLTSQTFTHTLNYRKEFVNHLNFDAIVGYEYFKTDYSNSTFSASGYNTNLTQSGRTSILYTSFLQNASTSNLPTIGIDPTSEIQSFFGRINFNLSDKYYLTATIRADGSNKFGANNKYGYFPSVGAKWVLSNEDFLKNNTLFSNLSLRGSWGITGNQEFPAGASLEQVSSSAYNAAGQTNVFNPNLKWEKTSTFNIGLDYSILKNRITGSFDYYYKNTTDILYQNSAIQPAPASIYFINLPANLINSGVELSINGTIVNKQDFAWNAGINVAYNNNKLKNFDQAPILTGAVNGNGVSSVFAQRIANNQPVDVFFLKQFTGFDANGQQTVSSSEVYYGDPNPHYILGFNSTLRYKKLSFVLNAGGSFDYMIYNNTLNTVTNVYPFSKGLNVSSSVFGKGEAVGDGAVASSRYLESGNYFKLRNATFSYSFGDLGKYIKNFNAFISGTNLFVITKFKGFDPEVNVDKSNNNYPSRSMEYLPYPTPRIISMGLNFGL